MIPPIGDESSKQYWPTVTSQVSASKDDSHARHTGMQYECCRPAIALLDVWSLSETVTTTLHFSVHVSAFYVTRGRGHGSVSCGRTAVRNTFTVRNFSAVTALPETGRWALPKSIQSILYHTGHGCSVVIWGTTLRDRRSRVSKMSLDFSTDLILPGTHFC